MSSLDYLDLCRLCLVKDRVSVPIFEGEGDVRQIFLKIAACLPVKVGREDKLPKKICDDCVYKVELFYQFWNTTANAEKQLLQWLGEVSLDEKQGYVTGAHNTSMMKPGQNSGENRLDGSVMQQQVNDQTSGMGMGMMDGMGMTMPIMIPNSGQQSQSQQPMTSVPMDTGGNAVQTVQAVPGPSAQIAQQKINPPTSQEEDEDESEEEDNSDDECDGDDGLPVKEESEDEPGNRTIEPTTFVNVSLACDEAGPSGLQQQKIGEMPEMVMPSTDGDPKSGSCEDEGSVGNMAEAEKNEVTVIVSTVPACTSALWKSPGDEVNGDILNPGGIVRSSIGSSKMAASFDRADGSVATDWHDCDKCGFKFPLEGMLNRHRVMSHSYESTGTRWITRKKGAWTPVDKSTIHERPVRQNGGKLRNDEERTVLPGLLVKTEVTSATSQPRHVCNFCEFACDGRAELTSHLASEHNILIFPDVTTSVRYETCDSSDDPRTRRRRRRENIPTNVQDEIHVCEYCDFSCKKRSTLTSHVSRKHRRETTASATRLPEVDGVNVDREYDDRDEKSTDAERLNASKSQMSNVLSCNSCSFESSNKRTMSSHKRRQHTIKPSADEIYRCNECDFKTAKKTSLYSHMKRKHKCAKSSYEDEDYGDEEDEGRKPTPTVELFGCGQCDYKNKNKYELKVHVARKHTDDFKFTCETCSKKFKVKGDLTNHVRFSHREQPVICDVCGKTCLNSNSLYVHQKFAHYKAKYECHMCKRRMVSQENLDEHMLRQHEKRESVVCEECGKTFSRNSRLKIHMRIHTGDRPYECQVCNRSFARRTALKQHLLIHTGVRPYVCDVCGKAFTQKPGLISHRKSHPGPLPPLPRVRIDHILNDVLKPNS